MRPDYLAAIVSHLKADSATATLVGTRVFGDELPRIEVNSMPRKCIVIRAAGGVGAGRGNNLTTIGDNRIDVRCYGETPYEAMRVERAAEDALKYGLKRKAYGECLLHSARVESSANSLREPNADWPFQFSSWMVTVSELQIA